MPKKKQRDTHAVSSLPFKVGRTPRRCQSHRIDTPSNFKQTQCLTFLSSEKVCIYRYINPTSFPRQRADSSTNASVELPSSCRIPVPTPCTTSKCFWRAAAASVAAAEYRRRASIVAEFFLSACTKLTFVSSSWEVSCWERRPSGEWVGEQAEACQLEI